MDCPYERPYVGMLCVSLNQCVCHVVTQNSRKCNIFRSPVGCWHASCVTQSVWGCVSCSEPKKVGGTAFLGRLYEKPYVGMLRVSLSMCVSCSDPK